MSKAEIKESENLKFAGEVKGVRFYEELGCLKGALGEFIEQACPDLSERIRFWEGMISEFERKGYYAGRLFDKCAGLYCGFEPSVANREVSPSSQSRIMSRLAKKANWSNQKNVLIMKSEDSRGGMLFYWHPGMGFDTYGHFYELLEKSKLQRASDKIYGARELDAAMEYYCEKRVKEWEELSREVPNYIGALEAAKEKERD